MEEQTQRGKARLEMLTVPRMPSGKVHDKLTLAAAILSVPAYLIASPAPTLPINLESYALGVAAFCLSGFYLSDDLDTAHCVALRRWGPMKFIWLPYQKLIPHRHWLSHGLCIGPLLRVAYFLAALWLIARCGLWLVNQWITPISRDTVLARSAAWLLTICYHHPILFSWTLAGIVLGGVVHTVADAVVSGVKRVW